MTGSSSCNSVSESSGNVNQDSKSCSITSNSSNRCNKKSVKTIEFATKASSVISCSRVWWWLLLSVKIICNSRPISITSSPRRCNRSSNHNATSNRIFTRVHLLRHPVRVCRPIRIYALRNCRSPIRITDLPSSWINLTMAIASCNRPFRPAQPSRNLGEHVVITFSRLFSNCHSFHLRSDVG